MNFRNNNKISDKEILKNICKNINRSIPMLAEDLKIKKQALYEVTNGRNCLSSRIKSKILDKFPNVNLEYLETGIGDIIIKNNPEKSIENKFNILIEMVKEIKKILT